MADISLDSPSWRRRWAPPALVAAAFALIIVVINPFREMLSPDDAWGYARMVQHLLATGQYQLDPWASANGPVQIYLAAALATIFGYSLILLRCTSVALLAVALGSFYLLLRELGRTRRITSCITLALLASPLVLLLGFSFMSDVQFLGWFLLALLLYVRGLRRRGAWTLFFASVAAGCAIGTRQFGMAILVGLMATLVLAPRLARPPLRLLLIASVVPFLAAAAQVIVGLRTPNIHQALHLYETHKMLTSPAHVLARELLWRCCIILQYAGMALVPLLPAVFAAPRAFWKQRFARVPLWGIALIAATAIVAAVSFPSIITARTRFNHGLWAPLVLWWALAGAFGQIPHVIRLLDLVGILGGATLAAILFSRLRSSRPLRSLSPEAIFLSTTALGLLALHLIYIQINDTYITAFVPFVLLLAAFHLQSFSISARRLRLCAAMSLIVALAVSLKIRADYDVETAVWSATESLNRAGVQPWNLSTFYPWHPYHGAFSEWVAAGAPGYDMYHHGRYVDSLHDPFFIWHDQHLENAQYRVMAADSPDAPAGWQVISSRGFRAVFRSRYVLVLKRLPVK